MSRPSYSPKLAAATMVIGLVGVLALLGGGIPGVIAAEAPGEPIAFYGTAVDADGDPAPEGVEIVAAVDGAVVDTIVVAEPGVFANGGPTDEKLRTHTAAGEEVTFHLGDVDGPQAEEAHAIDDAGVFELDLTFPAGAFEEAPPLAFFPPEDDPDPVEILEAVEEIHDAVDLPDHVEPLRAERTTPAFDEATGTSVASFTGDSPIQEIVFDGPVPGEVTVTELAAPPADTPGAAVAAVHIDVPSGATSTAATIRAVVSQSDVAAAGGDVDDLHLLRHTNGAWTPLETTVVEERPGEYVIEAETPGFSLFAASAIAPPVAAIDVSSVAIEAGESIALDGGASTDRYGEIVAYEWTVDGERLSGVTASVTLDDPGEYVVELTVTNDAGQVDAATVSVTVEAAALTTPDDPAPPVDPTPPTHLILGHVTPVGVILAGAVAALVGAILLWRRGIRRE